MLLFDPEEDEQSQQFCEPFKKYADSEVMRESIRTIFNVKVQSLCSDINDSMKKCDEGLKCAFVVEDAVGTTIKLDK